MSLRRATPQEIMDLRAELAALYRGGIEDRITALIMDPKVGRSADWRETARVKAKHIIQMFISKR
jgi:hypothetical protein